MVFSRRWMSYLPHNLKGYTWYSFIEVRVGVFHVQYMYQMLYTHTRLYASLTTFKWILDAHRRCEYPLPFVVAFRGIVSQECQHHLRLVSNF